MDSRPRLHRHPAGVPGAQRTPNIAIMYNKKPEVGTTVTRQIKVVLCSTCRCEVEGGLCHYDCPQDGEGGDREYIIAVYESTMKYLGDVGDSSLEESNPTT